MGSKKLPRGQTLVIGPKPVNRAPLVTSFEKRNGWVVVCSQSEVSVTQLCEECGLRPAKQKYCSGACRQKAYRKSPKHKANLQQKRDRRSARRKAWERDKYAARSLGIHGWSGPVNDWVGRLGDRAL